MVTAIGRSFLGLVAVFVHWRGSGGTGLREPGTATCPDRRVGDEKSGRKCSGRSGLRAFGPITQGSCDKPPVPTCPGRASRGDRGLGLGASRSQ